MKKNSYESTDVTYHGGVEYGSDIHNVTIRTNQIVWDMIKILDRNELFGFHFQTKISTHKTIIIMRHKDQEMLDRAKNILVDFKYIPDVLFLSKLKKQKESKKILKIIFGIALLSIAIFGLYEFGLYLYNHKSLYFPKEEKKTKIVDENNITVIKLDIQKLKAIKESFDKENTPIQPKVMKAMNITTAIISDMVPPSKKAKYSSEELVKNFKGKGGIRFEIDDSNKSKDFNQTIKELKSYADHFVKDKNISGALKCYDKILQSKNKSIKADDKANILSQKANLDRLIGDLNSSKDNYLKSLNITAKLSKENPQKYIATEAFSLSHLSQIEQDLNLTKIAHKDMLKAQKKYQDGLVKFTKLYKSNPKKYAEDLAWNYNVLANFYLDDMEDLNKSIGYRVQSLKLYKKLYKKNPKKFLLSLFKTTNSLAKTYMKIGNIKEAKINYENGFKLISQTKYNKYIALSHHNLGFVYAKESDFKHAILEYNQAEKLYKSPAQIAQIHYDMASLYSYQKKFKLAKDSYIKVIQEYKILNKKSDIYNGKIAKTQNKIAWIYLTQSKFKNYKKAKEILLNSIKLANSIKKIDHIEFKETLAQTYSYLAHLALLNNHIDKSLSYYQHSLSIKRDFQTDMRYSKLLVAQNKLLEAFKNFEIMSKTYKGIEQQAKIAMEYGEFYISINKSVAKERLQESLKLYTQLSKINNKEYIEIKSLRYDIQH